MISRDTARELREQEETERREDVLSSLSCSFGSAIADRMNTNSDRSTWRFAINGGPIVGYDEAVRQLRALKETA